ncbi:MAG: sugar ABC transporter permease [Rhodospirillaceae bacterium]|nr:sugar ABC transporter permease [Rhodospirillaceae bacterium]MCA8932659.1 sugar ABC transporter permease [Rhodospirillaceae bacterium]
MPEDRAAAASGGVARFTGWLQRHLPKIVVAPSFLAALVFFYGFIIWTAYISLTGSRMLPDYEIEGFDNYVNIWRLSRWNTAVENLAIFGILFIGMSMVVGCILAVLLDQRIRAEGALRTIYLYPMAISYIVTGTAWRWLMDPGIGIEAAVRNLGWESFSFDWITNRDMAIYTIVIAAVWQASGFVMAMVLAALRGVDQEIIKAAWLDGASLPQIYRRIIIPSIRPVFLGAFVILMHLAIKTFDLIMAMTSGGPGTATSLPATFMYDMAFQRDRLDFAATSAVMMLVTVTAIVVPYLYSEIRAGRRD